MLHFGKSVRLVSGPSWSFKITDRVDLALAETILARPDLFPSLLACR
jgi:2-C-methyl-D-erythritol 4-phosphate cytidylyltransferase